MLKNTYTDRQQSFNAVNHAKVSIDAQTLMTVFEHQYLLASDFLHSYDFDWLLSQEFVAFSLKRKRGQWQLKVGHYVGIIILPSGITLEILPKAIASDKDNKAQPHQDIAQTRQWVQRMLMDLRNNFDGQYPKSKNLGQLSQNLAPLSDQPPPLSEWLHNQFMQRLAVYQPTQQYQLDIQNQSTLQGKLLIKEQLRRNSMQPHKFISEVSALSQEMLSNRLIKSALLLLAPLHSSLWLVWRHVSALNQHELQQLEVLYIAAKRQLSMQPLMHQQRHAAQYLLDLSYWLLQMQQSTMANGVVLSAQNDTTAIPKQLKLCLLIDMQQAFEQWASMRIAATFNDVTDEQLQYSYQPYFQPRDVWLRDSTGQACLSTQPDLLIYRTILANKAAAISKQECRYVIDIKWKHLAYARDISASDAYQLTSYAQAYQAKQVWLVYPVTDSKRAPIALHQQASITTAEQGELWLMPFNVLTGMINDGSIAK